MRGFEKRDKLSRDNEKGRGAGYSFRNPTSILYDEGTRRQGDKGRMWIADCR